MDNIKPIFYNHEYWRYRGYETSQQDITENANISNLNIQVTKEANLNTVKVKVVLESNFYLISQNNTVVLMGSKQKNRSEPELRNQRFTMLSFVDGNIENFYVYNPFCVTAYNYDNSDMLQIDDLPNTSQYFHLYLDINGKKIRIDQSNFTLSLQEIEMVIPFREFDEGENVPLTLSAWFKAGNSRQMYRFGNGLILNLDDDAYKTMRDFPNGGTLSLSINFTSSEGMQNYVRASFQRDIYPETLTVVESTSFAQLHSLEFLQAYINALNSMLAMLFPEIYKKGALFKIETHDNNTKAEIFYRKSPFVEYTPFKTTSVEIPFPVKALSIIARENLIKKMMDIEGIPIMVRTPDQLKDLGNMAIQLGRLKEVGYIACQFCQNSVPDFKFGFHVICKDCAKMAKRKTND